MICNNCEESPAQWRCHDCLSENCFCDACRDLHCKFKVFRLHTSYSSLKVEKQSIICGNCEKSLAKFVCQTCTNENERYLCLGCSLYHDKFKAFRGHSVVSFDQTSDETLSQMSLGTRIYQDMKTHLQRLEIFAQDLINGKVEASLEMKVLITISAIVVFLLCKYIFGSSSLVVNMGAVVGIYYYLQQRKDKQLKGRQNFLQENLYSEPKPKNQQKSDLSYNISQKRPFAFNISLKEMETEFPNEFPYEVNGKPASLRKRGRPYEARSTHSKGINKKSFPNDVLSQYSDDEMIAPSKAKAGNK